MYTAPIVGGHLALDFLNTVATPANEPVDYLPNGTALLRWLVDAGALGGSEARSLHQRLSSAALDASAARAVTLREWLRPIVQRSAARGRSVLEAAEVEHLNGLLAHGYSYLQLACSGPRCTLERARHWRSGTTLLVLLSEAIADLLATADFSLVRKCANPQCTLWFLDQTKAHRRRWCSMALCGNRSKVAAHRRRTRSLR